MTACVGTVSSASIYELGIWVNGALIKACRGNTFICAVYDLSSSEVEGIVSVKITCNLSSSAVPDERFNFLQAIRIK